MIGELLLYLLVTDPRTLSDEDLRELLYLIVGFTEEPEHEVQEEAVRLLQEEVLDRETVANLPYLYPALLPPAMAGFEEALESFDQVLEEAFDDETAEDNERVERFRACLEMLDDESSWERRSEAARGVGTLEEELYRHRDDYVAQPLQIVDCTSRSVVAHGNLLEAFDTWQQAFRRAHEGELDEALESAVEATCLLMAVQRWSAL